MAEENGGGTVIPFPEAWRRPGFVVSEAAVAAAFAHECGSVFAYSPQRRIWRRYDGVRWVDDPGALLLHLALDPMLADIAEIVRKPREQQRIGSSGFYSGVERELRHLMRVDEEDFDADPWLLNCPGGTHDLRVGGVVREHDPGHRITKLAACDPGGECAGWMGFLRWVTCEDAELAGYLQRLAGYALTGVADEQMLAFLYGGGANGKTVFMQTLLNVLGNYGVSVPGEVFLVSQFERHPEEMMRMRGARLIVASEVPFNAHWNETRLKAVTGGERVMARFMRENTVEFLSTGTLMIAGNNKPTLRGMDDGIRRRFQIVPFNAKVDADARDKQMADHLMREASGILAWMIEGCRAWQRQKGLQAPSAVTTATEEYLEDQDFIEQWVEECCNDARKITGATVSEKIGTLYASWRKWAEGNGISPGGINAFSTRLHNAGFKRITGRGRGGRRFRSISIYHESMPV